ncbi:hypothetical protein [Lichenicoccus sp.]|uniref:hypothetical protein n=1 Tax=Lichenicoccus sp. TaxID=2781899 RepID=UPI003D0BD650
MKQFLVLLWAVALGCNSITAAAVVPAQDWNPDETAPMTNAVASAAAHARATLCKTPSCKAIIIIHELVDIARFEDGNANGLASLNTGNRPRIAGRRVDHVLLGHPDLYGPVCATGAKVISHFRLTAGIYEMIVPVQLLMHGVEMDLRSHGHCAQDLLAALPGIPENDQVRISASELCDSDYENHSRPKAACDVLIQGLKPEP